MRNLWRLGVVLLLFGMLCPGCAPRTPEAEEARAVERQQRQLERMQRAMERQAKPRKSWFAKLSQLVIPARERAPVAVPPTVVGTVTLVDPAGKYVLIDCQVLQAAPPGESLIIIADGYETASLRAAERKPPFLIADIVSGRPRPGDSVYANPPPQ